MSTAMKLKLGFVASVYIASVVLLIFILSRMNPDQINGFFVAIGFVFFWAIFMLFALFALIEFSPQITLNKKEGE